LPLGYTFQKDPQYAISAISLVRGDHIKAPMGWIYYFKNYPALFNYNISASYPTDLDDTVPKNGDSIAGFVRHTKDAWRFPGLDKGQEEWLKFWGAQTIERDNERVVVTACVHS